MSPGPQLRDIQLPPEPGLWPWPPGVWLLLLVAVLLVARLVLHARRRAVRRRALQRWQGAMRAILEDSTAAGVERVAAASELLRRAVRQRDPEAAVLEGARWRAHLAALGPLPADDPGLDLLVEGPWRPRLADTDTELALSRANERLQRLLETFP
ncbi:DUF4381 domain-containing protein [Aquimonas voraii]|uniref:DUF4381 domain-containing protein n=1 Tax=Aquimonas voraii TaxID=265719 RepID=A0A1G6ZLP7_9GAMM|nr:DUF4381 domain-containing protein [Aquimonas voraii]SDE02486.1 protein of unknown function [Aquimonas voraii]